MTKTEEDKLKNLEDFVNSEEYKLVKKLKKKGISYEQILNVVDEASKARRTQIGSYSISNDHTKMLVFGDSHIGNNAYDPKIMNTAAKIAKSENVDLVVCTGDIADGWYQNRPSSIFEQNEIGFDNQMRRSVSELSKILDVGKPFYYITGNHEYNTFVRGAGVEFGEILKLKLDGKGYESYFLGNAEGDIKLETGALIKLLHPDGGTAYALSYKPQKIIESLNNADNRLPNVALIGHFHKAEHIPNYMGVDVYQTGTLCGQTKYMRGKGIAAHKGFWVIDLYSKKNGKTDKIDSNFYPFK